MFTSLLTSIAILLFQTAGAPFIPNDIFLPQERAKIEREDSVEKRIKVYQAASRRIQKSLETAVLKGDFSAVPRNLQIWSALLSKSLEDIEANLKTKKKSRALIKFEIDVRKSITHTEDLKIRAPADQQDLFDKCIATAEAVHKRFVEILFRH
jgi:exonuclease III